MKKRYIILEIIVLLIIIGVGVTFAYLSISKTQDSINNFTTGCLNIEIESKSDAINIENAVSKSDLNGLKENGYTFTIHNTCSTSANYEINLEELSDPSNINTLNANYLKVALSSDTFDNIITKLGENTKVTKYISNSYKSYNLYNGTIEGSKTKEFILKEWIDYDVTKEEGLNKSIKTKINVISGTNKGKEIIPSEISEIKFDNTTGTIIGETTNIKYCISKDNICTPDKAITAKSNKLEVTLTGEESKKIVATSLGNLEVNVNSEQIICTAINENKTICSNPISIIAAHFNGTSCKNGTNSTYKNQAGVVGNCDLEENGLYEAEDNDGTSYYFRGSVENNYVKFGKMGGADNPGADIWWRIIRINGDGSIRMIYAGTGSEVPDQRTGKTTMINNGQYYQFNTKQNDNMYVGFEYASGIRNGNVHNYGNNESAVKSNALTQLNIWFEKNLSDEFNEGVVTLIDTNSGFCGDRSSYSGTNESTKNNETFGIGTKETYFGAFIRMKPKGNNPGNGNPANPTYKCEDEENDLYTYKNSNKGTKSLTYPIGLISADEVTYAGSLLYKNNTSYYLYNNDYYWTVSPSNFYSTTAWIFHVRSSGNLDGYEPSVSNGLRPVINLKSNSIISGDGTPSNPFKTVE